MQLAPDTDICRALKVVNEPLAQVKKLIDVQSAGCHESVSRLLEHFGSCRGKLLRPALVLLAGAACGKITDEHIRVAAVVEMIHNATLLHDDVIDEGQSRRGGPTVNSLWGNESAVLLGDFLLSRVFRMCAELGRGVTTIIADTAVRICQGELRQVMQRQNLRLSESGYIEIITEKSAVLFRSCCLLGGLLAGTSDVQVESLSDFGLNVGIAFQIVDDLLDIIGDENKTGKTQGSDANKNEPTLAVIHLLKATDEAGRGELESKLDATSDCKGALLEMLKSSGSLEYAHERAQEFVAKAIASLADLKEGDAKEALIEVAEFAGNRVT